MPRPSLKSAQAKQQQINGQNKFSSLHNEPESGSTYSSSEDEALPDEPATAIKKTLQKAPPRPIKTKTFGICLSTEMYWANFSLSQNMAQKRNQPVIYTGGSRATKFQKKSYWKNAAKNCSTLDSFFPVSPGFNKEYV